MEKTQNAGEDQRTKNGLRACPECRSQDVETNCVKDGGEITHWVRCKKCGYAFGPYALLWAAISEWNKIPRPITEEAESEIVADFITAGEPDGKSTLKRPDKLSMIMLPIEQLRNHPKNVRKTYEDIDELAESIRARGIMQNLTVVPAPGHEEKLDLYYVVIGNRRLQAAQKAGVQRVPCSIAFDMPEREQISIMVTENMQRTDLSLIEQAEGFQLMLDLGETVQTIHEKTGLSETTVRHRLKLAELGTEYIRKRQAREDKFTAKAEEQGNTDGLVKCYQLSLSDYVALEKIKSVKQRRDILEKAESPSNLRWRVEEALRQEQEQKQKDLKAFGELMQSMGIRRDDKKGRWASGFETFREYKLRDGVPPSVGIPEKYSKKVKDMYWCNSYGTLCILAPVSKTKPKKTKAEIEQEERQKKEKELKKVLQEARNETADFVRSICDGKGGKPGNDNGLVPELWHFFLGGKRGAWVEKSISVREWLGKKAGYEALTDKDYADFDELALWKQMIITVSCKMDKDMWKGLVNWRGEYDKEKAADIVEWYNFLNGLGFTFSTDEHLGVLEGTDPRYRKE